MKEDRLNQINQIKVGKKRTLVKHTQQIEVENTGKDNENTSIQNEKKDQIKEVPIVVEVHDTVETPIVAEVEKIVEVQIAAIQVFSC